MCSNLELRTYRPNLSLASGPDSDASEQKAEPGAHDDDLKSEVDYDPDEPEQEVTEAASGQVNVNDSNDSERQNLEKAVQDLRNQNNSEANESLTRLYELLENQRLSQQALLSKLTSQADEKAAKDNIWAAMLSRNIETLGPLLEQTSASALVSMRDQENGFTVLHHITRLGLGPALEFVLNKAPVLADAVSAPMGRAGNWTALMVLVDTPFGSIGGPDYAYKMLTLLLAYMSSTAIQSLGDQLNLQIFIP